MPSLPVPPSAPTPKNDNLSLWQGLGLVWEIGYIITLPAVALGFLGAWLDKRWDLSPLFVLCGLALAFLLSTFAVVRSVRTFVSSMNAR